MANINLSNRFKEKLEKDQGLNGIVNTTLSTFGEILVDNKLYFFGEWVYKYQGVNCSNVTILRCYPPGEIFPFRDSNGNTKYDSVYHTIK